MAFSFAKTADLAIDLGTSSTRLVVRGQGVVAEVPTVVATHTGPRGREIVAVGADAKQMLGRTPAGTEVVRPVRGGVVTDFMATEHLLRDLLAKAGGRSLLLKPRVLVCVPTTHSEVERRAVQDCTRSAGARDVILVSSPMAAAIGAELPVNKPLGSLVVDLGGGHTDAAVLSLGGVVVVRSVQTGGDTLDVAIVDHLRTKHGLLIGERTAEGIKLRVGCAKPPAAPLDTRIRGRDLGAGVPREVDLTSDEICAALAPAVAALRDAVLGVLRDTPPELAADILQRGIVICGGTARLPGLDQLIRDATGLPVVMVDEPTRTVARGASALLDEPDLFARVVLSPG